MSAVPSVILVRLIFIFLKLRKILIVLSVLQSVQIKAACATAIPSFIYKPVKPTATPSTNFLETLDFSLEHGILTICTCTLLVAIAILICVSTLLDAEITNGFSCVRFLLYSMPLCPSYWTAVIPNNITYISIKGLRSPLLHFHWDCCELINNLTDKRLVVKTNFTLSWRLQAYKLRKLLVTSYCIYFYIQHDNLLIPLPYTSR